MPEIDTLIQLPWKPEVAWVTGDLIMGGEPVEQNPRQVLKRVLARPDASGLDLKTGVECEYFLIRPTAGPSRMPPTSRASPATTSRR